jgi:hypothetical protein
LLEASVMSKRKLPRRLRVALPAAPATPPAASTAGIGVPLPFGPRQAVGLGDVVKRVTSAVGIRPCSGCQRRAEALNRLVTFGGRSVPRRSR